MDAAPFLVEVGRALGAVSLDAVLIGNAGAALQGAPVTTLDFDFLFRRTPRNLAKLKQFASRLEATVLRPYYPVSDLFRVVRDDGLQVDFMGTVHGVRSYEGVRARATMVDVAGVAIAVAALADIIKSKKAAGRPQDLAVVHVLERAHARQETAKASEESKSPSRRARPRKRSRAR